MSDGSTAVISACGLFRYELERRWDFLDQRPPVVFLMVNPSTADALEDDPTIRRCVGFARHWGFPALRVVNLFAFRATDPCQLLDARDAIGPDNDAHIERAIALGTPVVCAWGSSVNRHNALTRRAWQVWERHLRRLGPERLRCLGVTRSDPPQPRHPLFVSRATPLYYLGEIISLPSAASASHRPLEERE